MIEKPIASIIHHFSSIEDQAKETPVIGYIFYRLIRCYLWGGQLGGY
jgi:hypothetical protein